MNHIREESKLKETSVTSKLKKEKSFVKTSDLKCLLNKFEDVAS